jgi:hypothetical protein
MSFQQYKKHNNLLNKNESYPQIIKELLFRVGRKNSVNQITCKNYYKTEV